MMGAIFTKVAPLKDNDSGLGVSTMFDESTPQKYLDPRSPNPFRTPISELAAHDATKPVSRVQNLTTDDNISTTTTVTPTKLKNKLLRDLGYNTFDPRSPALNFDRTSIIFNDSIVSDDFSFAGLSLDECDANVRAPVKIDQSEMFHTPVPEKDKIVESHIDPRSPSIDIERTPLTILDNPQAKEEETNDEPPTKDEIVDATVTTETVKNMIYMDENQEQPQTPNIKTDVTEKGEKIRTPLSCLMNSTDNRNDKRLKMHNSKTVLARKIFKESAASASKTNCSSSRISVLRKSLSKEINN